MRASTVSNLGYSANANPTYSKDYSALKVIQKLSKFNQATGFQPQPPDELVKLHTITVHTFGFMTFFHNLPVARNEPRIRGDLNSGYPGYLTHSRLDI
jgi:hypothetical protein